MTDIVREENLASFVGKNEEYYLRKWDVYERYNEKTTWNWESFFYSANLIMYSKMYIT